MDNNQRIRYSRHLLLPEIGEAGQEKLLTAKVLVIGAGGLGSPLLLYLAAAGIGTIGIVDDDRVDLSNLQRQVLHETEDIGRPKVESAKDALLDLSPNTHIRTYAERLTAANAAAIISDYDIIADGCDNFATRLLVNQHCYQLKKPLVSAAVQGFSGQLSTFKAHLGAPHPCYQCIYANVADDGTAPTCAEAGVLGSVAGVMGTLQATEVIKELLKIGESLSGKLTLFNALNTSLRTIKAPRDPECPVCSTGSSEAIA